MGGQPALLYDELWASSVGATPWIVDHEPVCARAHANRVSQADIALASGRVAALLAQQGVRPGERCVVWLERPVDVIAAAAAITAVGAVPILVSPMIGSEMLARMLEPLDGVDRVVTSTERTGPAADLHVRYRTDDWATLLDECRKLEPLRESRRLPGDAPYVVTHTSGTTGVPKLLQYTRRATDHNSVLHEVPAKWGRLRGTAAAALSPVHYRAMVGLLAALRRRVSLMVLEDQRPDSVGPMVEEFRPTYLEAHPNTLMQWEGLADRGSFRSVKYFLSTFDVLHPGTVKRLLAGSSSPLAVLIEVYGQSEAAGIAWRLHVKGIAGKLFEPRVRHLLGGHPIGWPIPMHSQVRVVDDGGRKVGAGDVGRIEIRSRGRFTTYINRQEEAEANTSADGWWDTGDLGRRSRLGRLTLIDRRVERLGVAPSAIAMEDVLLYRMPWLLEAVVLEIDGGLVPVVTTRGEHFDPDRWAAGTHGLPPMGPPRVLPLSAFPRTATGKVQRAQLAKIVLECEAG